MLPPPEITGPALATSVLVVRDVGTDVEVLMARRRSDLRHLGGFWVFPGGSVDSSDASIAAAAARELCEETGLQALHKDGVVDTDRILPWARWITPSQAKRRFDTYFFLMSLPPGQEARCDDSEIDELRWVKPGDWGFGEWVGQFPIAPPTQLILRELAEETITHGSTGGLLQAARSRRVRPVMPKIHPTQPGLVVFPWDAEYAQLPGESLVWDDSSIAERASWPGRLAASAAIQKRLGEPPVPSNR
jgi:8-oxo-dGTP pyrophosphatase MutT (NUDIX family)